ncbi:MAG TPA: helix-turn-helix domain-containing protein [Verrucomicrobiae bacterium]|jgi:excisionase family DNA binding protein
MPNGGESEAVKPAGLQLLTKKEVARLLACSVRMVERLVASGKLPTVKIRGAVRFRLGDIEQIIVKGAV